MSLLLFDPSEAFESALLRVGLQYKLKFYSFPYSTMKIVNSYLANCKQYIFVNSA